MKPTICVYSRRTHPAVVAMLCSRAVVVALALTCCVGGGQAVSCSNLSDWSHILYDYIRLPEAEYRSRLQEWSLFCNNVSHTLSPTDLRQEWAKFSSFLPLTECLTTSLNRPVDGATSLLGVSISQLVLVIVAVLIYYIRVWKKYGFAADTRPVRDPGNDFHRGAQL